MTREELIDKACEWLRKEAAYYVYYGEMNVEDMIKDFRKDFQDLSINANKRNL